MNHWKRNVALFLAGQGITLFGSMLVYYAIMWHIIFKTQSGVMITLITAGGTLPMFFISPFGGVWADRYNKKHIINIADGVIAAVTLIMAIIFSLDLGYTGLLIVCLAVRALGQGVQTPAVNALVPQLVPQEHLTRVNGISGGVHSFVMFASPMAGGALLAFAPIQTLMFIDVVTAAIGIGVLYFCVKVPAQQEKTPAAGGARQYFHEIAEGARYVRGQAFLKRFLLLSVVFNVLVAPVATMTPLQVARNYGDGLWQVLGSLSFGPEQRLAVVEIAFFVGMMAGGFVMGLWGGFKNKSHTMAVSTFLLGAGAVGLGLISNFWAYLLCMGLSGVVLNLFNPPLMATLQTHVDSAYMGRVFSVLTMVSSLTMPAAMLVWGPLGDAIAIDWMLVGTGLGIFLMGFVFIFDKTLLRAGMPVPPAEDGQGAA